MAQSEVNPIEVIFIAMTAGNSVHKKFPSYYRLKYESNPDTLLEKAIKEGYLTQGINFEEGFNNLKVNDLKDILRKFRLKVSGKKSELIERILSEIPNSKLSTIFTDEQFIITEKGENFVKKNEFAVIYHKNKDISNFISMDDYYKLCLDQPNITPTKVIENYFLQNASQDMVSQNWPGYRDILLILLGITKDIKYKCLLCFVDINFLAFLTPKILPNKSEVDEFKQIFTYEVRPLSNLSPVYSIDETLNIILEAIEYGIVFVENKNSKIQNIRNNPDDKIDKNIEKTEEENTSYGLDKRQYQPIFFEGKYKKKSSLTNKIVYGALIFVILGILFNKFNKTVQDVKIIQVTSSLALDNLNPQEIKTDYLSSEDLTNSKKLNE